MAKRTYSSIDSQIEDDDILMDDEVNNQESHSNSNQKSKSAFNFVTGLISIILLLSSLVFGYLYLQEENRNFAVIKLWDEIKGVANKDTSDGGSGVSSESAYSTDPIDRDINFAELWKINNDVSCWIYIPDTQIDYPVMQEPKYGEYLYLSKDIYKNDFVSGSIFIPKLPDGFTEDAHLLMFGHNMRNGSMFSMLLEYKSKKFYEDHPYIYLYYPDRTEKWEIWSAYHTSQKDIVYHMPYELNTEEYATLINNINSKKSYTTSVTNVTASTKILSLSTCDKVDNNSGRYLVNAVMVDVKYID